MVNQVTEETDIKRNVIRNKKKLWPGNKVLFFVDPKLRKLERKIIAQSLLLLGSLQCFQGVVCLVSCSYLKIHES